MITVDTCGMTNYSPLIPAIKAMCNANPGDKMEIVTDQVAAFQDLKEYLSEQGDRKSTRLNSSHLKLSRMPSSA